MKKITFLLFLLLFTTFKAFSQCDLLFNPENATFVAGESASIIVCFQDYSSGLPAYEKADYDTSPSDGLPDVTVINAVPGSVNVIVMGTGNTIDNTYCIKVTFTVGTANLTSLSVTANGNTNSCSITESKSYVTLPIVLESFDVKREKDILKFNWITSSEINNDFFTVEMSENGKEFSSIGEIKGAQNSHERLEYNYSYTLKDFDVPFLYFRLKQTDNDGRSTYSDVKLFINNLKDKFHFVVNNLNISDDRLEFELTSMGQNEMNVSVYDLNGNKYLESKSFNVFSGNYIYALPLKSIKDGIYIVQLVNIGKSEVRKVFAN